MLRVPLIKRKSLLTSEIRKNNISILNKDKIGLIGKNKPKMTDFIEKAEFLPEKKANIQNNSETVKIKTNYHEFKSFIHDLYNSQEKNQ